MSGIRTLSRRQFIKILYSFGLGTLASGYITNLFHKKNHTEALALDTIGYVHEALFYEKVDDNTVKCFLCPHECILPDGQRSFCRAREAHKAKLYSLVYELVCSMHIDPIEKKPIYHMLPGSRSFSIATAGCNSRCKYCQNWQISQSPPENTRNEILTVPRLIELARKNDCKSIAYTYSEPTIFYEYMLDASKWARINDIKNVYVTGSYINKEPLNLLCKHIDAVNADLKGFDDNYLRSTCGQQLKPVLDAIQIMYNEGVWVEITNLIVPTLNDDMNMIKDMCVWIRDTLSPDVPLHFSRFWPMYKLNNLYPTPIETLEKALDIALSTGLNHVYLGNIPDHRANHTYCKKCKKIIIKRLGYLIAENHITNSRCAYCQEKIPGIWK